VTSGRPPVGSDTSFDELLARSSLGAPHADPDPAELDRALDCLMEIEAEEKKRRKAGHPVMCPVCLESVLPKDKQLCGRCSDTCNRIRFVDSSPHAIATWAARRARRFERARVRQREETRRIARAAIKKGC
jgi:hypothetical protein